MAGNQELKGVSPPWTPYLCGIIDVGNDPVSSAVRAEKHVNGLVLPLVRQIIDVCII